MMNVQVERNAEGFWCHPEFDWDLLPEERMLRMAMGREEGAKCCRWEAKP